MSWAWAWGAALGVALAVMSHSRPAASAQRPTFPSRKYDKADLIRAARVVEAATQMPGFADFAVGVAQNESRFVSTAIDDSKGATTQAARGYDGNPRRYGGSPWPRSHYTWGTGGWYQMLPSTALADRAWNHEDPMLMFQPLASTVLLAAFVQRVARNHFSKLPETERNWLAIRRFLRSNTMGLDYLEQLENTAAKRERFGRDLEKNGIPASFMYRSVPRNTVRATPDLYRKLLATPGVDFDA